MLNQSFVALRHRIIPNLKMGVTLIRLGRADSVKASLIINYVRYKNNGRTERKTMIGPTLVNTATMHFYKAELGDWVLQEEDIVVVDREWWKIEEIDRRQMQTKFVCTCLASAPIAGIGSFTVEGTFQVG